jgi:hypothetical protein
MSERLDLYRKGQESTSHQAALVILLVIGGINLINTKHQDMGNCKEAKHGDQRKCLKARLRQRERKAESKGGGHKQQTTGRAKNKPKPKEKEREREQQGAESRGNSENTGCHRGKAREMFGQYGAQMIFTRQT